MIPMRLWSRFLRRYRMDRATINRLQHNLSVYSPFSINGGILNHPKQDGSHRRLMSSLGSYSKAVENLTRLVNQRLNQEKQELRTSQSQNSTYDSLETVDQNQTKPFSIIQRRSTNSMQSTCGIKTGTSYERLESGMVLLKNYISLSDQVEIVNTCQEFGLGPGGFYQPCNSNGTKLQLHMMCFGRNWDPQTKYKERVRDDGSIAPPLPDKLISLAEAALQDSRANKKSKDEIPLMSPNICIVNFYTTAGRLGLHQDRDESYHSLKRGLPVVSISVGDDAEFLYGCTREVRRAKKVLLRSGDVLIFGGKSRHVFHGVTKVIPDSAPLPLLKETMLRPGRLNLTFRRHQKLVSGFFENARVMLSLRGEIHVTHRITDPYKRWSIEELPRRSSLKILERVNFRLTDYLGYHIKMGDGNGSDEPFRVEKDVQVRTLQVTRVFNRDQRNLV